MAQHAPLLALVIDGRPDVPMPDGYEGIVGRDPAAALVIDDPQVGWRHAELVAVKDCVWIRDLSETHSLRWNGEPVDGWAALLPGDVVQFGAVRATVRALPYPDQAMVVALFVFAMGLAVLLLGSAIS
jgi:pSer/pThr/pTyr-binding forkhead associated (FHA) protein